MNRDKPPSPCVAVWGAAGFIGRHTVDALLRRGWRVRGLGRARVTSKNANNDRYEEHRLDFEASGAALAKALEGATCAVHCAGHYDADETELERYVDSVRNLALAARDFQLDRLVIISSIAVYGSNPRAPVTSATIPQPDTPYSRSRLRAEQEAQATLAATRTRLVVVRVPAVVGADMRSDVLRRFFSALRPGLFLHPGRIDATFPCIGIHRLAECIACVTDVQASEPPSLLQPVDCIPWIELANRYGRAMGRRLPRIGLPANLVRGVCRVLGYDLVRALNTLDCTVHYQDDSSSLVTRCSLPRSIDDIDALIESIRQ